MKDDVISRQAVKEMMCVKHCTAYPTCQQKYGCYKIHDLELLPSVKPTYTDAEVQKMQDMEQSQLDKAFELGREDAKAEIIRCRDCRWQKDQSGSTAWLPCRVLVTPDDFYCGRAERRTDERF